MTNGEATTQQFDGSTPPPTKRRRTHRTNWYRFKRGAPVASRGALGACRQQPRQLLETWARAGQCRKRVMWARASEEERTKLFLSSVPTLRRLLLQWSPNQILAAERKKLEQLLSQPKAQFPNPPKETLEHEKNRAKGPPKAHLLPKGLRTTQGCSSSSAESQLSQEGQHQRSHDWKKTKRVGEADNPGQCQQHDAVDEDEDEGVKEDVDEDGMEDVDEMVLQSLFHLQFHSTTQLDSIPPGGLTPHRGVRATPPAARRSPGQQRCSEVVSELYLGWGANSDRP